MNKAGAVLIMVRSLTLTALSLVLSVECAEAADQPFAAVTDVEVVAERDNPQICLTFNGRLDRSGAVPYRDYVTVTPADGASVTTRDHTLCVEGLTHHRYYTVTLRDGLPLADGRTLAEETIALPIPDRKPGLAFRGAGYPLARLDADNLSLRSVNINRVRLKIARIDDDAVVEKAYFGRVSQQLSEAEATDLADHAAHEVWQGEMAMAPDRNRPVQTAFPLEAAMGALSAGVYVAEAEANPAPEPTASEPTASVAAPDANSGMAPAAATPTPAGTAAAPDANAAPTRAAVATGGAEAAPAPVKAIQWFVVSDTGLSSIRGADGLLVFARKLATEEPAAGVDLRLLSVGGGEIAKAVTGADGLARFSAEALAGAGDQRAVVVRGGGDFALLDLVSASPDEADHQAPAEAVFAHLHANRGIYRPGETVDLMALVRDEKGAAVAGPAPVLSLRRPDGFEVDRFSTEDAGDGAYPLSIPLPATAKPGQWTVVAKRGADGPVIGQTEFVVEDFVPPRFGVGLTADRAAIGRDGALNLAVSAGRMAGVPAAGLPGEVQATVRVAKTPFPKLDGYRFGLAQDQMAPKRVALPGFVTDANGHADVAVHLPPPPDSSHALEAVVDAAIVDLGGRRVERQLVLPLARRPVSIGIRPKFEVDDLPEGATAAFDVIAVDGDGNPVDATGLSYELIEEEASYDWFESEGHWDYKVGVKDRRVTGGTLDVHAQQPARLEEPVGAGRFRIEVYDAKSGAQTSVRFASGWWLGPTEPIKPDQVDVAVMLPTYKAGDVAKVYVQPPYRSLVLITLVDRQVRMAVTREIGPEGAFLDIPVDPAWTGGVHVIATAFAKPDPQHKGVQRRAVGSSWLAVTPAGRTLDVGLKAPETALAGDTATATIKVAGANAGQPVFVSLSAVDEVVLGMTGFSPFDPVAEVFGPREPAVDVRDLFGRMTAAGTAPADRPVQVRATPLMAPGTAPDRKTPIVSLFSGVLKADADGTVAVPLHLPHFAGRLRLTATAWTTDQVGRGETWLKVAQPVPVSLMVPATMSVDDVARSTGWVRAGEAAAGVYHLVARGEGGVEVGAPEPETLTIAAGQRGSFTVPVTAKGAGHGRVVVEVTAPDGTTAVETRSVTVTAAVAPAIRHQAMTLTRESGALAPSTDLVAGMDGARARIYLSAGVTAGLDLPGLLSQTFTGPLAGTEAAASRVVSLLAEGATGADLGLWRAETVGPAIRQAIDALLSYQRADGLFAVSDAAGDGDPWLTAFAVDALRRAQAAGIAVPQPPYRAAIEALRRSLDNTWVANGDLPARAYALYVLARIKAVDPDTLTHFREAFWSQLPTDLARAQVLAAAAALGGDPTPDAFQPLTGVRVVSAGLTDHGSNLRDLAAMVGTMVEAGAARETVAAALGQLNKTLAGVAVVSDQERAWLLAAARVLGDRGGAVKFQLGDQAIDRAQAVVERLQGLPPTLATAGDAPVPVTLTAIGPAEAPPPAAEQGLSLKRGVFDMAGNPVPVDKARLDASYVIILEGRLAGEPADLRALITDIVPAGFEIDTVRQGDGASLGGLGWIGPLSTLDWLKVRDNRIDAVAGLSRQVPWFRVAYVVRAVIPGHFADPPARVVDIDRPSRFATGTLGAVDIGKE